MTRLSPPARPFHLRAAADTDAPAMSAVLLPILRGWNSDRRGDPDHVRTHYISHPDRVSCVVALDDAGRVVGFQSLKRTGPGNIYDLPPGWGVIGTYVDPTLARGGAGRAMFAHTLDAARAAGLRDIDATIGAANTAALGFYDALGFVTWRDLSGAVGKRLKLA